MRLSGVNGLATEKSVGRVAPRSLESLGQVKLSASFSWREAAARFPAGKIVVGIPEPIAPHATHGSPSAEAGGGRLLVEWLVGHIAAP
jgi:hypothetical protein